MPDFSILLGGVNARLSAAGDNVEQRAKILRALSSADEALQQESVRYTETGGVRGVAYRNVQQLLAHAQHPERPLEYVSPESEKEIYDTEVDRLWKIVERILAEKLD